MTTSSRIVIKMTTNSVLPSILILCIWLLDPVIGLRACGTFSAVLVSVYS